MVNDKVRENFRALFGNEVLFDEPLAGYTTIMAGGPADVFVRVREKFQIVNVQKLSRDHSLSVFVLGGGSNILIGDRGYRGVAGFS